MSGIRLCGAGLLGPALIAPGAAAQVTLVNETVPAGLTAKHHADLIGIPYRITVGKKLAQGKVEVVNRRTKESQDVAVEDAPAFLRKTLTSLHGG